MPLTVEELRKQTAHFASRTARFASAGYDRFGAPQFILDEAGAIEGPVLDVGTGMGMTARALAGRGFDVVSVDLNANDQQVAEFLTDDPEARRRIRFSLSDAARLPFPDGYFGSAVAVDVLHHLDAGGPVLTEMLRVVKPEGLVVLADFSAAGFDMVSRVHAAEGGTHPEGPATVDWARGFMSGLGMTELKISGGHLHRVAVFRTPAALVQAPPAFEALDRPGLFKALDVFAKSWLAHDGCWFLAAEERYGMETAMDLDAASWRRFAVAEARRIMEAFSIPPGGGLDALQQALSYRMYSFVNPSRVERSPERDVLRFFMETCRVQETRRRKGLPDFPCKTVGVVEFETFARTVDARIATTCLSCPPDPGADGHCGWEFRLTHDEQP
jgi:ubiquinone/menaquinone biosynthesis C-methylase UbiE